MRDLTGVIPLRIAVCVMVILDAICSILWRYPRVMRARASPESYRDEYVTVRPTKVSFIKMTHEQVCAVALRKMDVSRADIPPYNYGSWKLALECWVIMCLCATLQRKAYAVLRADTGFQAHLKESVLKLRQVASKMEKNKTWYELGAVLKAFTENVSSAANCAAMNSPPIFDPALATYEYSLLTEQFKVHRYWRTTAASPETDAAILARYISGRLGAGFFDYFNCASKGELSQWAVDFAVCESVKVVLWAHAKTFTNGTSTTADFLSRIEVASKLAPITKVATLSRDTHDDTLDLCKIVFDIAGSGNLDIITSYKDKNVLERVYWALTQPGEIVYGLQRTRVDLMKNRLKNPEVTEENLMHLLLLSQIGVIGVDGRNNCAFVSEFQPKRRVLLADAGVTGKILNALGFREALVGSELIIAVPNTSISFQSSAAPVASGILHLKPSARRIAEGTTINASNRYGAAT
jgi:hypothetical protein